MMEPTRPDNGQDFLVKLDLAELDRRIHYAEQELSALKRVRRAKMGGLARNRVARPRRFSDQVILEVYIKNGGGSYGSLKATAAELSISWKTVWRAVCRDA